MNVSRLQTEGLRKPLAKASSFLHRPVAVGRLGEPKSVRQAVSILARMLREDVVIAWRHYFLVSLAGAYAIPRPVRFVLYRMAGMRVQQSDIAPGLNVAGPPGNLTIGHGTSINVECFFDCAGKVTVGRNVMMGMGTMIVTSDHPIGPDGRPQPAFVGREVVIGDHVWLGARSMVLPGVVIGERAVISAGSVVTRDCRPHGVYAGVPARLVGNLSPEVASGEGSGASASRSGDPLR